MPPCRASTPCTFWVGRTRSTCCAADAASDTVTTAATETTGDDEALTCSICLDEINLEAPHVSMGCSHKFHGQCLVDHLIHDVRCPMCRFDPHAVESDEDEDEEERVPRVSLKEALKEARKDKKKNARTLATIAKWKDKKKEGIAKLREIAAKMRPDETAMETRIELFEAKERADLDFKFAAELVERKEALNGLSQARVQRRAAEKRLAQKYGYIPYRSSWRRSRSRRRASD